MKKPPQDPHDLAKLPDEGGLAFALDENVTSRSVSIGATSCTCSSTQTASIPKVSPR